jgi:hypothetical protein
MAATALLRSGQSINVWQLAVALSEMISAN